MDEVAESRTVIHKPEEKNVMNTKQAIEIDPLITPLQGETTPDPNGDTPPNPDTGPPKG
jgi:hypothetical protein